MRRVAVLEGPDRQVSVETGGLDFRINDGFLDGREIECPMHEGKFDVCSGRALCALLTEDIRT